MDLQLALWKRTSASTCVRGTYTHRWPSVILEPKHHNALFVCPHPPPTPCALSVLCSIGGRLSMLTNKSFESNVKLDPRLSFLSYLGAATRVLAERCWVINSHNVKPELKMSCKQSHNHPHTHSCCHTFTSLCGLVLKGREAGLCRLSDWVTAVP